MGKGGKEKKEGKGEQKGNFVSPLCELILTMWDEDHDDFDPNADIYDEDMQLGVMGPNETVFDMIRSDYAKLGLENWAEITPPEELEVTSSSTGGLLDPSPTADDCMFWGSPLGIDGWKPDFTLHHYPSIIIHPEYLLPVEDEEEARKKGQTWDAVMERRGGVHFAGMPNFRFYATNLTKNESIHLMHRTRNLCPAAELLAIAKNCNESAEGKSHPGHCWRENTLYIKCNELKKQYLNNRQRLIYIYGSIRDEFIDWNEEIETHSPKFDPETEPDPLDHTHLYVYRWEFYRLQYKEAKRKQFIRQMKAFKDHQKLTFWKRLMSPSTWFTGPVSPPRAPQHIKNYLYQGHHWLDEKDIRYGPPMEPDDYARSAFNDEDPDFWLTDEDLDHLESPNKG